MIGFLIRLAIIGGTAYVSFKAGRAAERGLANVGREVLDFYYRERAVIVYNLQNAGDEETKEALEIKLECIERLIDQTLTEFGWKR